jgi:hypothetical protein
MGGGKQMKFNELLHQTLNEIHETDEDLCVAVYTDNLDDANAIVMVMDQGNFAHIHAFMQVLHDKLSHKMGHPVSVCHNHPSDESILVHSRPWDARVYYGSECCKLTTLEACSRYWATREGYRLDLQMLVEYAENMVNRCDEYGTVHQLLESLDWNEDPLPQLIRKDLQGK